MRTASHPNCIDAFAQEAMQSSGCAFAVSGQIHKALTKCHRQAFISAGERRFAPHLVVSREKVTQNLLGEQHHLKPAFTLNVDP
jgi:hypothetical protein